MNSYSVASVSLRSEEKPRLLAQLYSLASVTHDIQDWNNNAENSGSWKHEYSLK